MHLLFLKRFKISFFIFISLLFSQFAFSQLSNFTLQVSAVNETCTGNGSLNFSVSGATAGATMIFSVYQLPNTTTPIATLSTNTLNGLVAGNYSVIATQSLGSQSNTQQQNVTILNQIVPLTYQLSGNNLACGVDGTITVNILSGTGVSYEIFAGPIIKPLQSSNIFTGLIAGTYQIRVFDSCGEGVVQTFIIFNAIAGQLTITSNNSNRPSNCTSVLVMQTLSANNSTPIAYPLSIQYTVFPPSGPPIILSQTLNSLGGVSQQIPLYPNQYYTYNFKVTDACGNIFSNNGNVVNSSTEPRLVLSSINCTDGSHFIAFAQSVILTSAPSTYTNPIPFNYPESNTLPGVFSLPNLPNGIYSFAITDVCGVLYNLSYNLSPSSFGNIDAFVLPGCEIGFGSIRIAKPQTTSFESVIITSAPTSYPNLLPHDVSSNIDANNFNFFMNSLPEGNYIFKTTDSCGLQFDVYQYIPGYQETLSVSIDQNCNSFNIDLNHNSNASSATFWLQKYNPLINQWVHPITGVVFNNSQDLSSSNAINLLNNTINYNFTYSGNFRILIDKVIYGNGVLFEHCIETLYEFEYFSTPRVNNVYSFTCPNNTYDVIVDASGFAPLIYRITTKNGNPFVIQNGNSSVFLGLEPALYNFQVQDACGNILNRLFDIPTPFTLLITPSNLCNGQTATLTTNLFDFLDYQWWKNTDTGVILSTTNSLSLPSFDFATDSGIYHVRVRYLNNPNSCIDFTLDYEISATEIMPNAGTGTAISYCGSQGTIDLFTLLTGPFDSNGTWVETTNSGALISNLWNSTAVTSGNYQFKYRVDGFCEAFDESIVDITINSIPETPIAFLEQIICDTQSLYLLASKIPNATYQWSGPNGFTSNEQNPIITPISSLNNGTYTVKVIENGCDSGESSIEVVVSSQPQFTLESTCIENAFTIQAIASNSSFETMVVAFSWIGPNNFTSTENPITITGLERGYYSLTVTNGDGCSFTDSIEVLNTMCSIPKGVSANGDGDNDTFDLSGFEVENLKIFNRYGLTVFEQNNYTNQWHGQDDNNNELPDATYYYLIKLATGEVKSGWVYLIR
jgi:gliding motility-associated-like protein